MDYLYLVIVGLAIKVIAYVLNLHRKEIMVVFVSLCMFVGTYLGVHVWVHLSAYSTH